MQLPSSLKILVVEDEDDSRWVINRILEDAGHDVIAASSGTEALSRFTKGSYDMAVIDIGLPDFNGIELLTRMRAIREIKAIALTGYGTPDDIRKSEEAGFLHHLIKPVEAHALQQIVARASKE